VENVPPELLECLPRNYMDYDSLERAKALGLPAIEPILLHLLSWLQDLNWSIGLAMADFLLTLDDVLIEPVRFVLRSDDAIWKYWVISELVKDWPRERIETIQEELRHLVTSPTGNEKAEEVPELAQEILNKHGL
jgi:hypothetical protein